MEDPSPPKPFHYGWAIVLTGLAVVFSCLGLSRFSLGMLLPSMGATLGLSYSQMGLIGTGNFIGYMASVILSGFVAGLLGARWTISAGLVLVGASTAVISQADGFGQILLLYTATGLGSGLANVPMMGLVSHWFTKAFRGRAAGGMLSGNGLAIVFSGFFIPWINTVQGPEGWRSSWLVIGLICLATAGFTALVLRNDPRQMGLSPLGPEDPPSAGSPGFSTQQNSHRKIMVHLGMIYLLFGATYSVFVTFIVTAMVNERGFGEGTAGTFWAVVGGLSIFSGPLFGAISDRLGRKTGMIMVYTLFTLAYMLAAASLPNPFLYASIAIFGLAVWSIPTIMSAAVGDYMGPSLAVKAFGFITLFFGGGQIVGPALAGYLTDIFGSFGMAFGLCALLSACAVALAWFLKPPESI